MAGSSRTLTHTAALTASTWVSPGGMHARGGISSCRRGQCCGAPRSPVLALAVASRLSVGLGNGISGYRESFGARPQEENKKEALMAVTQIDGHKFSGSGNRYTTIDVNIPPDTVLVTVALHGAAGGGTQDAGIKHYRRGLDCRATAAPERRSRRCVAQRSVPKNTGYRSPRLSSSGAKR
jgi:hypothetical protein